MKNRSFSYEAACISILVEQEKGEREREREGEKENQCEGEEMNQRCLRW